MTAPNLDAVKRWLELGDKAAKGPWHDQVRFEGPIGPRLETYHACGPFHEENPWGDHNDKAYRDADFIAASRNVTEDVRLLLLAYEELKARMEGLEK